MRRRRNAVVRQRLFFLCKNGIGNGKKPLEQNVVENRPVAAGAQQIICRNCRIYRDINNKLCIIAGAAADIERVEKRMLFVAFAIVPCIAKVDEPSDKKTGLLQRGAFLFGNGCRRKHIAQHFPENIGGKIRRTQRLRTQFRR